MKDTKARIISMISIVIVVLGLSLGFAAYSSSLTIMPSPKVLPDGDIFDVSFNKTPDGKRDNIIPASTSENTEATDAKVDNITNLTPAIKNIHVIFNEPGQYVTYTFYVKNKGDLKAYLKNVTFNNVTGEIYKKICIPKSKSASEKSLVQSACKNISLTLKLGNESFTDTKSRNQFSSKTAHDLDKKGYEQIEVLIAYEKSSNQKRPQAGFDILFGDIVLSYNSAK